ncbi:MAG: ornithine carbamoyltransferase [Candidatus Marinimicrobia bacterium]|jgi:ornithine carbamoyltransferase|nr:ornithine carbamoyltransferase [Candidatus Neomarinimicrobiota bacterium]MDD5710414.1 ornithine carbamoyltransferase [Candidatus Neomarinimicrobiota bacterium]MDX9778374.1 ornithine carbamoyltransferase [bacterium]
MSATLLHGKDLITFQEWTKQEINMVLDSAADLKRRFALNEAHRLLQDKTLFMMFFEQSTRTRNSMEAGMTQLGGHAHDLTPDKMQLSHGESAKDTAMVLSRMGHAIACRNCFYGIGNTYLRELAEHSAIPVLSLQDDLYHPMQVIADLMTIREYFGLDLKGLKVTISWAYATSHAKPLSVPLSQLLLFPRYGMDVTVAAPKEFPLYKDLIPVAEQNAAENGGKLRFTDDMDAAFEGAQIVIPKNWGGFGNYSFEEYNAGEEACRKEMKANLEKHRDWICDERRMKLADKDVKYMHALPADRGNEVTPGVIDSPAAIIYDEAENRLHTAKAVMALTMGGRP